MNAEGFENMPNPMEDDPDDGLIDDYPRGYLHFLVNDFDIEAQLRSIRCLLDQHRKAAQDYTAEIRESEENIGKVEGLLRADYEQGQLLDRLYDATYHDAAHSMAAVGMLAPLLETFFSQSFRSIGTKWLKAASPTKDDERWRETESLFWDCHNFIKKGSVDDNLVKGILQLSIATGLKKRLPDDIEITLSALFAYRNKMFHCGFEWPIDERRKFQKRIKDANWPKPWFSGATKGDEPWIFYMTYEFIEHCLSTIEKVIDAFAEYVRDELLITPNPNGSTR